jgi:CheY-like chemotaxis protein
VNTVDRGSAAVRPRILCVDDDRTIGAVVEAALRDAGYAVSCLHDFTDETLRRAIGQTEPDSILLDGSAATDYERSWHAAAWIRQQPNSIPVVMFSARHADRREAQERFTERARLAAVAAVVLRPFLMDELIEAVGSTVLLPPDVR